MEEEVARYIYVTLSWKELNYRNSRYLNGRRVVQRNYRKNWKSIPIEIVRMRIFIRYRSTISLTFACTCNFFISK